MEIYGPARVGGNDVRYMKNQTNNSTAFASQVPQAAAQRITGLKEEDPYLHADISVDGQKISFAEMETADKQKE